ncbi:MAG: hypothetical protein KAQ67_04720 [Gammaproteobacteria bacterium]|nr:hypothetical protein [Gammaproteobacteria bacterium]
MSTVMPGEGSSAADSSKDPLRLMIEIVKDENISDDDKKALIKFASSRFKNRRRMAYVSLLAIVISLLFIFLGALIDGASSCPTGTTCTSFLNTINENQSLIAWIEGFLTSIVAAYFGVSSWRPAS